MSESTNNNKETRLVCPKGMKLPTAIKAMAAQLPGSLSNAERKHFMKVMGIALAESSKFTKSNARGNRSSNNVNMPTKSTHTPAGTAL